MNWLWIERLPRPERNGSGVRAKKLVCSVRRRKIGTS